MSDTTASLELLEQLAVNAPHEPQPWFIPVVPPPPKRDPKWELCDGCKEDSDCIGGKDCDNLRAYYEADRKHREQVKVERLVQWPWAWARAVLNARHAGVVVDGNVVTVNRQAVFDHFASEHDLILTESEMVEIAHVVSKDLCDRITSLINENTALRADSKMLARFVEKINAATPEFKSAMGSDADHAELALSHLIKQRSGSNAELVEALKDTRRHIEELYRQAARTTVSNGLAHALERAKALTNPIIKYENLNS